MGLEVCDTGWGKFQIEPLDCIGMTTKTGVLWDGPGFLQVIAAEHGLKLECDWATGKVNRGTIIDIGANIGTFSIWCAHEGAERVVAVEPVPATMLMLKASLALNRFCDSIVIPLEIAAWDRSGQMRIAAWDPANIGATALISSPVPAIKCAPLDDFAHLFGSRVSLIKCDAQGSDLRALQGLAVTIDRDSPFIVFEWEAELAAVHGDTWGDCENFLAQVGYEWRAWPTHPGNFVAWRKK